MLTTRQAVRLARSQGFVCIRTTGHQRWQHTKTGAIVTIPHKMKSESISKRIELQIKRGAAAATA